MKFCPKCGSILMPVKKGDELVLKCPSCGYEEEIKGNIKKDYTIEAKSNAEAKVKTTSIVSEGRSAFRSREELEQEKEEFYEVFLELMSGEERGGEGE